MLLCDEVYSHTDDDQHNGSHKDQNNTILNNSENKTECRNNAVGKSEKEENCPRLSTFSTCPSECESFYRDLRWHRVTETWTWCHETKKMTYKRITCNMHFLIDKFVLSIKKSYEYGLSFLKFVFWLLIKFLIKNSCKTGVEYVNFAVYVCILL